MSDVDMMYCSLCLRVHGRPRLNEGWFARGFRRYKDTAKRLICPDCLKEVMPIKSSNTVGRIAQETSVKQGTSKLVSNQRLFN